ncbi:MAG: acyltransferase [Firmicutes bacterium]|nr:acyltransferase [Bacillota bacterium]
MKNLLISNLHKKDVEHFTTNFGLYIRRVMDKPFKKLCNIFTNANIIREENDSNLTDEEYFSALNTDYVASETYNLKKNKNNIIVERYPELNKDEPYIFVCNHTCPEDIETVLNILDRNAYLILGSIESLKYNPEMYLSWLNGMVPFDIMDKVQRKQVLEKMLRVLKTNSILIFPEGSHNYNPNKLVNNLFDGPINLALRTNRKIVVVTLIKDDENNLSYIDVSNPLDVRDIKVNMNGQFDSDEALEKYYVKSLSSVLRDKMATAVYHLISRHTKPLKRDEYDNIEEQLRMKKIQEAFDKLKWERDVFDAEYLTKKTEEERTHEEIVRTLSNLTINTQVLKGYSNKHWVLSELNIDNKDVPLQMRNYLLSIEKSKTKKLKRGKM